MALLPNFRLGAPQADGAPVKSGEASAPADLFGLVLSALTPAGMETPHGAPAPQPEPAPQSEAALQPGPKNVSQMLIGERAPSGPQEEAALPNLELGDLDLDLPALEAALALQTVAPPPPQPARLRAIGAEPVRGADALTGGAPEMAEPVRTPEVARPPENAAWKAPVISGAPAPAKAVAAEPRTIAAEGADTPDATPVVPPATIAATRLPSAPTTITPPAPQPLPITPSAVPPARAPIAAPARAIPETATARPVAPALARLLNGIMRQAAAPAGAVPAATQISAQISATAISAAQVATVQPFLGEQPAAAPAAFAPLQPAPLPGGAMPAQAPLAAQTMPRTLDLEGGSEWLDGLARDIARTADGDAPLRFRLNPAHLGTLQVELSQGQNGTSLRLTAETEAARAIIADAQPRLLAEARAQGVRIEETHVDLGGSERHAHDPRRQEGQGDGRADRALNRAAARSDDASADTPDRPAPPRAERYA